MINRQISGIEKMFFFYQFEGFLIEHDKIDEKVFQMANRVALMSISVVTMNIR